MLCEGMHSEEMYSWEMHCEEMHSGKILSKGVESDDKHIVHSSRSACSHRDA